MQDRRATWYTVSNDKALNLANDSNFLCVSRDDRLIATSEGDSVKVALTEAAKLEKADQEAY